MEERKSKIHRLSLVSKVKAISSVINSAEKEEEDKRFAKFVPSLIPHINIEKKDYENFNQVSAALQSTVT